jgi:putative ABC transport system permease protein
LINVRYNPGNVDEILGFLENKWKEYVNGYPFSYTFLDERINRFYNAERLTGEIFKYFTFLSIFISCLGLFGMASFTAGQMTKEIGIRKVLGASELSVVKLISKEFLKIILAAIVISIPAGWYLSNLWLQSFACRTDISLTVFIMSGVLTIVIVFASISYQAVKAAKSDPVDSLKYE